MSEYSKYRNKNRGYMKLDVWHKAIELYKLIWKVVYVDNKIDFKLKALLHRPKLQLLLRPRLLLLPKLLLGKEFVQEALLLLTRSRSFAGMGVPKLEFGNEGETDFQSGVLHCLKRDSCAILHISNETIPFLNSFG